MYTTTKLVKAVLQMAIKRCAVPTLTGISATTCNTARYVIKIIVPQNLFSPSFRNAMARNAWRMGPHLDSQTNPK